MRVCAHARLSTGVLVDPRDPRDIAAYSLRIIGDRDAWQTFSEQRQRVTERYTWERTAESYLGQIATTTARPDARRPEDLLPIHSYLRGISADEVTPDELRTLYFVWEREWARSDAAAAGKQARPVVGLGVGPCARPPGRTKIGILSKHDAGVGESRRCLGKEHRTLGICKALSGEGVATMALPIAVDSGSFSRVLPPDQQRHDIDRRRGNIGPGVRHLTGDDDVRVVL